jgi:hypothetical protein
MPFLSEVTVDTVQIIQSSVVNTDWLAAFSKNVLPNSSLALVAAESDK